MTTYPKWTLTTRLATVLTSAFWLGGLTFYSAVVIRVAHKVVGSHRDVGFITRRVTNWINVAAVVALAALLVNLIRTGRNSGRGLWVGLVATWGLLAVLQIVLIALHPMLDRALDPDAGTILNRQGFYRLHQVYLIASSLQMLAGVFHAGYVLRAWQRQGARGWASPAGTTPSVPLPRTGTDVRRDDMRRHNGLRTWLWIVLCVLVVIGGTGALTWWFWLDTYHPSRSTRASCTGTATGACGNSRRRSARRGPRRSSALWTTGRSSRRSTWPSRRS